MGVRVLFGFLSIAYRGRLRTVLLRIWAKALRLPDYSSLERVESLRSVEQILGIWYIGSRHFRGELGGGAMMVMIK